MIAFVDGTLDSTHASLRGANIEVIDRTRTEHPAAREHATFIASVFAGAGPECLGLASACALLNVGVIDHAMIDGGAPRESAARLADAIAVASYRGASILQLSLDLTFSSNEARRVVTAVEGAVGRGAVVVVAAGQRRFAPASPLSVVPGVIHVSGLDRLGNALHSVHRTAALNFCGVLAPSIDIPGAVLPSGTASRSGTSYAACFVTAALALMCSATRGMTPRDAAQRLLAQRRGSRRYAVAPMLDVDDCVKRTHSTHEDTDVRYA